MKVGMITGQQIRINSLIGGAIRHQLMSHDFMQVEIAGEQRLIMTTVEKLFTAGNQAAGGCSAWWQRTGITSPVIGCA
jgi:hypothetical protein